MSITPYKPQEYITIDEALSHVGFTDSDIKQLTVTIKNQYLNWVREANTRVENVMSNYADSIPLEADSPELAYAKSAALNWVMYKKRDLAGSRNAESAKSDHKMDLQTLIDMLRKKPTSRTYPIGVKKTDSLGNYLIPYSQTQGFPPDLLY